MTTTQATRAAELAARFAESKRSDEQVALSGAAERRAIVNELLTLMPAPEVARLLGVSIARIGQLVGGVRK